MFEKSLLDMVKGLRANKDRRNQYINQCVQEIKEEIKRDDRDIKSQAVMKLAHVTLKDITFCHIFNFFWWAVYAWNSNWLVQPKKKKQENWYYVWGQIFTSLKSWAIQLSDTGVWYFFPEFSHTEILIFLSTSKRKLQSLKKQNILEHFFLESKIDNG